MTSLAVFLNRLVVLILKRYFFILFWISIVNLNFSTSIMDRVTDIFITNLSKGSDLDSDQFTDFRTVSDLLFIGKLIERLFLKSTLVI